MKKIFTCCCIAAVAGFYSCKNSMVSDKNTEKPLITALPATPGDVTGVYTGDFGISKINILISKATNDLVEGLSMTGGIVTPFSGKIEKHKGALVITANEKGTGRTDGSFQFMISDGTPGKMTGSWMPYTKDAGITKKDFMLDKKLVRYAKEAGDYPQASNRLLKEADVNNLLKIQLELMRNEIFARHGYYFTNKSMREIFEHTDWYVPYDADVKQDLTDTEKKNIALIKKYEKYAEEYGEDFGR